MYNPELRAPAAAAMKNMEASAKQHNVKLRFSVSGAPDHVLYHLLEADSLDAVRTWLSVVPLKQDFRITPVESSIELSAWADREWGTSS